MSQPNVCSKSYTNANNRHVSIAVASLSPAAAAGGSVEEAAQGSSKVLLLLQRLQAMAPGHKAVVFSQVRDCVQFVTRPLGEREFAVKK